MFRNKTKEDAMKYMIKYSDVKLTKIKQTFTSSKSITETLQEDVKYVQLTIMTIMTPDRCH